MKYYLYLLSMVLVLPLAVQAQEQTAKTFSLDEAIAYALENSVNAKNAKLDEEISKARVREITGMGLPQIDGSATVLHNQQLGRFFSKKQTAYGFSDASDETSPNYVPYDQFLPGLKDDDVLASQNFFQLKSNGQAGISVSQLLFNTTYLVGLKASRTYKELSEKQTELTRQQIIENVSKAYYAVIINSERIKLFDSNIARVDSLLRSTKAFNANGFVESIDVDRTEVTLNNLLAERDKFVSIQELGFNLLKFQMNYPLEMDIAVTGVIDDLKVDRDISFLAQDWDYTTRIEYSILETNRDLQTLNIKSKYSEGLPSLVGFADFGMGTQSNNIGGIFKTNSNLDETEFLGPDKWYPTSSFGISLSVPIFSGLQRNYRIQQEKLAALKIENSFISLKQGISLEIKQGTLTYENALRSLDTQNRNMELADKIAKVTKVKYEQGVGSSLEVTDAEGALREAQINYYNALYDALVSRIDLVKAYGKINTITTTFQK